MSEFDPATTIPLDRPGTVMVSEFPLISYFQMIQQVIEKGGHHNLLAALRTRLGRPVNLHDIREIRIFSEKHGSDYHPAKVEVGLPDQVLSFAANVALTERGRFVLSNEFKILCSLNHEYDLCYLPKAYFLEEADPHSGAGVSPPPFGYTWRNGWKGFMNFTFQSIRPTADKK